MTEVPIATDHGDMPAYVSTPTTPGPWPGVVVIHDAMGMGADTRVQTDWLAGEGFLAGAPERLERALTANAVPHDVKEYPGAGHGFLNDHESVGDPIPFMVKVMRPLMGYGPDATCTEDARRRITAFFGEHLRA